MGMYKYLRKTYETEAYKELMKQRIISWNKEPVFVKLEGPTKIDRARELGYKAKQGFIIVRVRIRKGSTKRETPAGGRKPLRAGRTKYKTEMNLQHIAEVRVARRYPNMEVLNSYYIAETGDRTWYEVILIDPAHPCIISDKQTKGICEQRRRAFRGLTSAGKKSRDL